MEDMSSTIKEEQSSKMQDIADSVFYSNTESGALTRRVEHNHPPIAKNIPKPAKKSLWRPVSYMDDDEDEQENKTSVTISTYNITKNESSRLDSSQKLNENDKHVHSLSTLFDETGARYTQEKFPSNATNQGHKQSPTARTSSSSEEESIISTDVPRRPTKEIVVNACDSTTSNSPNSACDSSPKISPNHNHPKTSNKRKCTNFNTVTCPAPNKLHKTTTEKHPASSITHVCFREPSKTTCNTPGCDDSGYHSPFSPNPDDVTDDSDNELHDNFPTKCSTYGQELISHFKKHSSHEPTRESPVSQFQNHPSFREFADRIQNMKIPSLIPDNNKKSNYERIFSTPSFSPDLNKHLNTTYSQKQEVLRESTVTSNSRTNDMSHFSQSRPWTQPQLVQHLLNMRLFQAYPSLVAPYRFPGYPTFIQHQQQSGGSRNNLRLPTVHPLDLLAFQSTPLSIPPGIMRHCASNVPIPHHTLTESYRIPPSVPSGLLIPHPAYVNPPGNLSQLSPAPPTTNGLSVEKSIKPSTGVVSNFSSSKVGCNIETQSQTLKRKSSQSASTHVRFHCDACTKSYSTMSGLSKHKQFHCSSQNNKAFSCKHCDKTYVSLGALKMHIRTHTLPCKCQICGKAFSRPWLLQGHVRTHTGEKPFSCVHCGRAFADRSNLRAHLQTHAEVKRYSCKGCSKTFSRMSLLTKHEDGCCLEGTSLN